jgi:tape measure domain-containing protein
MADNLQEYSIGIEFDTAIRKIQKFREIMNDTNKTMAKQKEVSIKSAHTAAMRTQKQLDKVIEKRQKEEHKREIDLAKLAASKRMSIEKRESARRKQAVSSITAPTGAGDMKAFYAKQEAEQKKLLKQRERAAAKEAKRQQATRNQTISGLTAKTGAPKASQTAFADMLKGEEAEAKKQSSERASKMKAEFAAQEKRNKITLQGVAAERKRLKALQDIKEELQATHLWKKKSLSVSEKQLKADIESGIEEKKTLTEMRRVVRLKMQEHNASKKVTKEMKKQNFLMQRMASSSKQLTGNMVSAFAIAAGVTSITKVGQDFERAENTLTAITGSTQEAQKEMKFLRDFTFQMGVPLRETAKDYAKLMAAAKGTLADDQLKGLFKDLTKASVVMGTTAEDTSGILKALSQMLAKQKIQAEEYRGQLGDRMPIALQAMTKAAVKAGVITDDMVVKFGSAQGALEKLMEQGKLYSKDVLPFFGDEISKIVDPGLEKAIKSNMNAMGRLMNVIESTGEAMFKSGFGEGLTDFFKSLAEFLKETEGLWKSLGRILGSMFKALSLILDVLRPIASMVGNIFNSITAALGDLSLIVVPFLTMFAYTLLPKSVKEVMLLTKVVKGLGKAWKGAAKWQMIAQLGLKGMLAILAGGAIEEVLLGISNPDNVDTLADRVRPQQEERANAISNAMSQVKPSFYTPVWMNTNTPIKVEVKGDVYMDKEKTGEIVATSDAMTETISRQQNNLR